MNTKKILFGLATIFMLGLVASCTSSDTAEEDALYKNSIKKMHLVRTV